MEAATGDDASATPSSIDSASKNLGETKPGPVNGYPDPDGHGPPAAARGRRQALDYQLVPQQNHWLATVFREATPGLTFLTQRYERAWLGDDVMAGLTVAAYLVPQVMAYSAIVGVPPATGLWTALVAMLVYALVGQSRVLSVGPESTIALLAGLSVAELAGGDPLRVVELTAALSLVVAMWCFIGRAFRLGVIADLLSQPLLVGYLAGAAALMIAGQLGKLTRTEVHGESILEQITTFIEVAGQTHFATLLVGVATLVVILVVHQLRPRWPAVLIGVVASIVVQVLLGLDRYGVEMVGEVPSGLVAPHLPTVSGSEFLQLVIAGLGVAIMAYSDNMLFARGFPAKPLPGERPSDAEVEPQSELSALGLVHVAVGAFGGFPVSSSGSRTALALAGRARTQVYSIAAALCVFIVLLFAGKITTMLPQAALGAVVVYAATHLIAVDKFVRLFRFGRREFLLAIVTLLGTMVYGILAGVGMAVALSLLEMGQRLARPSAAVLGRVPGVAGMHDVSHYKNCETIPGLVIFRYDAPLFFANIGDLRRKVQRIVDQEAKAFPDTPLRWLLINVEAVTEIDITAADGLRAIQQDLASTGVELGFVRIKAELFQTLQRAGVIELVGQDRLFPTLPVAEDAYLAWVEANPAEPTNAGEGDSAADAGPGKRATRGVWSPDDADPA